MSDVKQKIAKFVDENLKTYQDISLQIHDKPEVSNYEFFACGILSEQLMLMIRMSMARPAEAPGWNG